MSKVLHPVQQSEQRNNPDFIFFCPGCKCGHAIWTAKRNSLGAVWEFNGDMEKPTFKPSLLIQSHEWTPPVTPENIEQWKKEPWEQTKKQKVCHSFITDGQIQFLSDCTHELAGQTVPLPEF